MKRYIRSDIDSEKNEYWRANRNNTKMYNRRLPEEYQSPKLQVKVSEVRPRVLENVLDQDKSVFQHLLEIHAIPSILTSAEMRNNPYYDIEDKLIQLVKGSSGSEFRTYAVPYAGGGHFGTGDIYTNNIHVNNNGEVRFGESSRWIDPDSVKPSTLKSYFFRG